MFWKLNNYLGNRGLSNEFMEGETCMNEYDVFKQFIKKEILVAIDEEDYERMKMLSSILELLSQVKKRLCPPGESKEIQKEVVPETIAQTELVGKKKKEKEETKKTKKLIKETIDEINESVEIAEEKENIVIESPETMVKVEKKLNGKRLPSPGKLVKGLKTPDRAFVFPVIDALMEFGGTAPRMQVVERVYEKMKHLLNDYDLSPMPYNKYVPRWKDTLHWVRLNLVARGILEKGTEKGIWSLTEYGKAYYATHKEREDNTDSEQSLPSETNTKEVENNVSYPTEISLPQIETQGQANISNNSDSHTEENINTF